MLQTNSKSMQKTDNSNPPDVFLALSIHDFLKKYFEWKKSESSSFSLRAVAKKLNFKSHSHLAMIVRGERLPQPETLKMLTDYIGLGDREYNYLLSLLLFQKAKSTKEKFRLGTMLTKQRSCVDELVLEVDGLAIFERWYHIAILEMTLMKDFIPDEKWISDQLGSTVSPAMALDAVERLLRAGLLEKTSNGVLKKANLVTKTKSKISTSAMRSYQKQMLQRASVAIENQSVTERLFMNVMFPFDTADIENAKDEIANFIESFRNKFSKPDGNSVYYFGGQFFGITKSNNNSSRSVIH